VGSNLYPGEVIKLHRAGFEHKLMSKLHFDELPSVLRDLRQYKPLRQAQDRPLDILEAFGSGF